MFSAFSKAKFNARSIRAGKSRASMSKQLDTISQQAMQFDRFPSHVRIDLVNENHFVNFTGATFALVTYVFTLACIRVVYINKFVVRHENLFYRKYSLEKKNV